MADFSIVETNVESGLNGRALMEFFFRAERSDEILSMVKMGMLEGSSVLKVVHAFLSHCPAPGDEFECCGARVRFYSFMKVPKNKKMCEDLSPREFANRLVAERNEVGVLEDKSARRHFVSLLGMLVAYVLANHFSPQSGFRWAGAMEFETRFLVFLWSAGFQILRFVRNVEGITTMQKGKKEIGLLTIGRALLSAIEVLPDDVQTEIRENAEKFDVEEARWLNGAILEFFKPPSAKPSYPEPTMGAAGASGSGEDAAVDESGEMYDCVVKIDSVDEILEDNGGWSCQFATGMREQLTGSSRPSSTRVKWDSSVVAVVGLYNKGKTFVLNNLAQAGLASGTTVHTEGLSFKIIKNKRVNHILLDTAGLHSPVLVSDENPERSLAVKKATEFFLEDLTFILSDFIVVVVTDLTSLDQEYIQKIIQKLRQDPNKVVKQLFVVHNFRDARTRENLQQLWKEQVLNCYKGGEVVKEQISCSDPKTGRLVTKEVDWMNARYSRHIYVANQDVPVGKDRNPWVFALLKAWLASLFVPLKREYSPISHMLDVSNRIIQFYIMHSRRLIYSEKDSRVIMDEDDPRFADDPGKVPQLKPATIDSHGFVFVDLDYVPRVDSYAAEDGLYLLMDVPGLVENYKITKVGFDVVRVAGERPNPTPELREIGACERKFGAFKKEFKIPPGFEIRGAKHSYEDGVIKVFLRRSQVIEDL